MRPITFWLFFSIPAIFLFYSSVSSAVAGGMSLRGMLLSNEWKWEQSRYNNDTQTTPANPGQYSLNFTEGGTFSGRADCNRIRGDYTLSGSRIALGPIVSTRAMCPPGSLDSNFLKDLENAAILFFEKGRLYIDLKYHSGTMTFLPGQKKNMAREAEKEQPVVCKTPRPEVCTMEYDPVCGERADNSQKTYSNGCRACSDQDVIRYRKGECL